MYFPLVVTAYQTVTTLSSKSYPQKIELNLLKNLYVMVKLAFQFCGYYRGSVV